MQSTATTVEEYLAELPADRREALQKVREVILANKPAEVEEGIQYGHIGYYIPHSLYPDGYHCDKTQPLPYMGLGSQKNHMGLYAFCIYGSTNLVEWFKEEYAKTGKKLDMGAACIRFKKLEQLPLDLVAEMIRRVPYKEFVEFYESNIPASKRKK